MFEHRPGKGNSYRPKLRVRGETGIAISEPVRDRSVRPEML